MIENKIKIGFFGGPEYSVFTLEILCAAGFEISFVVTSPDRPSGRKLTITPPPVKVWANEHNILVLQPEKLKDPVFIETLKQYDCDVFIVMAYGKIIPESILNIPKGKTLNIHPSLLPKFRGPSPIKSAILADKKNTGVTIIRLDKDIDHGPIIAKKEISIEPWPLQDEELGKILVQAGSDLLVSILPDWIAHKIPEIEQDHNQASFTKEIKKEDGLIDLSEDPYENFLKIQAFHDWPSTYFFVNNKRIKITKANFKDGKLEIKKVIPEGKREMDYKDFLLLK